jgi:serine/threonine protein kinase
MGEVYRANDDRLGRGVAIKTLPPEFARDAARLERLRREARLLASLNHPNIAAIYGLEESAEAAYLVLELVEGDTPRGPLPLAAALDLARQVAAALQAAHESGIVHRDMKPANVRVTPQGIVKVLDFGLAKAVWGMAGEPPVPLPATPPGVGTVTGLVLGTPGYTSPEQARAQEVDQRTDVWSFGWSSTSCSRESGRSRAKLRPRRSPPCSRASLTGRRCRPKRLPECVSCCGSAYTRKWASASRAWPTPAPRSMRCSAAEVAGGPWSAEPAGPVSRSRPSPSPCSRGSWACGSTGTITAPAG